MKSKLNWAWASSLATLLLVSGLCPAQEATESADPTRGMRLKSSTSLPAYRQTWALIIGINYQGGVTDSLGRAQLLELKNAVNDAKLLASTLGTYYGDSSSNFGYCDDAHLKLLLEAEATEENILSEVARLCDPNVVKPEDSVLIFFAGHAVRLDEKSRKYGDAVALLPHDARLSPEGEAIVNTIGLPYGLVSRLKHSPAKHKLLVLDCCYSGEIFELPSANAKEDIVFKDRLTEATDRRDQSLQIEPAFQALASCRRTQTASDGSRENSPFTEALVDGLKRLPARFPGDPRVWTNLLLFHIRPNPTFDESQKPDCRNLLGTDGEFCFYPSPRASFASFVVSANEETLLQASVASRQGNWWFEEMPWFIPSIRAEILQQREQARAASILELIEPKEIKKLTEGFLRADFGGDPLKTMRSAHAKSMLSAQSSGDYEKTLIAVRDELLLHYSPPNVAARQLNLNRDRNLLDLDASDVHLLAIVQHALRDEENSAATFQDAIQRYESEAEKRPVLHILKALCEADFGELLFAEGRSPEEAAAQFITALTTIRKFTGPFGATGGTTDRSAIFEIYVLCREADAWLSVSHWKKANDCLRNALDKAKSLDPDHYLTAHVNRRRAWAEIIQWRLGEAERSFEQSNAILGKLFRKDLELQAGTPLQAARPSIADTQPRVEDQQPMVQRIDAGQAHDRDTFVLPPEYHRSADFSSKIAYLHNLHGIAMSRRFQGDALVSAQCYRELVGMVETTFTDFQERVVDADLNDQLLGRIINTQERLGDCNLFGSPESRDLKEALDDYRRAMHRVHWLRDLRVRDRWTAILSYKQALALSLPSSIQDVDLALQMCSRADEIFSAQRESANGLYQALGLLTTQVVKSVAQTSMRDPEGKANLQLDSQALQASPSDLRSTILAFRDAIGATPHRDELELCLFSSKVLLEQGSQENRHRVLEDADLLLSFCTIGLTPYRSSLGYDVPESALTSSDSRAYLRPYFDAAMRAKLDVSHNNVRGLLEIQREATQGTYYVKSREAMPILATYILDGQCYLFLDLPRGQSQCVPLADMYDIHRIHEACYAADSQRLPLPGSIRRLLANWWRASGKAADQYAAWEHDYCWWEDPMHDFVEAAIVSSGPSPSGERAVSKPSVGHFPFDLQSLLETAQPGP